MIFFLFLAVTALGCSALRARSSVYMRAGPLVHAWLLGMGIVPILLLALDALKVRITSQSIGAAAMASAVVLVLYARLGVNSSGNYPRKGRFLQNALVVIMSSAAVTIAAARLPGYTHDSVAYYFGKGVDIAHRGTVSPQHIALLGQGLYPLLLPGYHAVAELFRVQHAEVVYSMFYGALLILTAMALAPVKPRVSTLAVALLATTPLVFLSGSSVLSNLPGATFLFAGTLLVARYVDHHENCVVPLAAVMFAFGALTRTELIIYTGAPAALLTACALRRDQPHVVSRFAFWFLAAAGPWFIWRVLHHKTLSAQLSIEWGNTGPTI